MIQKVKRDTLSDQVKDGITAYIQQNNLGPGDSLPSENHLAEAFGVSRPVIREALKALEGEGWVEMVTGKSAVIKPMSSTVLRRYFERAVTLDEATFRDLTEVRRGLEVQSVRLAAQRYSDEHLAALERIFDRMRQHTTDHEQFADDDVQFHLEIASASGNQLLYHLIDSLRGALREAALNGVRYRATRNQQQIILTRHAAILQALRARDPEQAQQAMHDHFDEAAIESSNPSPSAADSAGRGATPAEPTDTAADAAKDQ